jgi:hypothetical protein
MKKQYFSVILLALLSLLSCKQLNDFNNNTNQWKPKDFDPTVDVLLIQNIDLTNGQIHRLEKWMISNYPYKFEFVKKSYNKDSAYSDRTTFRFVLVPSRKEIDVDYITAGSGTTGSSYTKRKEMVYDFNFYDRLKRISSARTGLYSSSAKLTFKTIINKCIKERNKNNNE